MLSRTPVLVGGVLAWLFVAAITLAADGAACKEEVERLAPTSVSGIAMSHEGTESGPVILTRESFLNSEFVFTIRAHVDHLLKGRYRQQIQQGFAKYKREWPKSIEDFDEFEAGVHRYLSTELQKKVFGEFAHSTTQQVNLPEVDETAVAEAMARIHSVWGGSNK